MGGRPQVGAGRWRGEPSRPSASPPGKGAGPGAPPPEPVTFEEVAVHLSRAEWEAMGAAQRELYGRVTRDTYELLASLGYPGPKPDVLYRLERGEEPWVCAPQSPLRWAGPESPPPGRAGDESQLERTQRPCPGAGHSGQWRLRASRLLRKFGGRRGRSRGSAEAAGGGAGPARSRDRARPDARGASADETCGGGCPPREQQKEEVAPGEIPQRTGPERLWGSGEGRAGDASETVWKDHCYCAVGPWCRTPGPLWEHNYSWHGGAGTSALRDHGYCHRRRGGAQEALTLAGKGWAVWQKSHIEQLLWRARRTVRYCRACALPVLEPPWDPAGAGSRPERPVLRTDPWEGAPGAFCPQATRDVVLAPPWRCGGARRGVSEAFCAPVVSFQHADLDGEAPQKQNVEGRGPSGRGYLPLRAACRMVLRRVDRGLASRGRGFELGGRSPCEDAWPGVVQIDG